MKRNRTNNNFASFTKVVLQKDCHDTSHLKMSISGRTLRFRSMNIQFSPNVLERKVAKKPWPLSGKKFRTVYKSEYNAWILKRCPRHDKKWS